jgi:hypothetical protein
MATLVDTRPLVEILRDSTRRLSLCLDTVSTRHGREAIKPEQMGALLSELLSAGASLRSQPLPARGNDLELDKELAEYRRQVERLRDLLPSIHRALLTERARIEAQRSRLQSATEWARASRQTL